MQKKTKANKKKKLIDPCPICNKELHLNHEFTQRVGLLGDFDEVVGWLCPHCKSEFDEDNHLTKFLGEGNIRGEA
tara:strand:+ start:833 stop:1057 length:225 start_codon:yes stop_codon:yes gene_type:complete